MNPETDISRLTKLDCYVDEKRTKEATANGVLLGEIAPSDDTEDMGWEVYYHAGEIIACITPGGGGNRITRDSLRFYVDDVGEAHRRLEARQITFGS
jgi:hypothetical protein